MEKKSKPTINPIENRMLFLSPTVEAELEKECCMSDFILDNPDSIGTGAFGTVWKVKHKRTNKIYAFKEMNKYNIEAKGMIEQINRETEIMYKLNHPYIIKLYNHFEDKRSIYLIMKYASGGQLYKLLHEKGKFEERQVAQYLREVINAIQYLHSFTPAIIHRDIKPENILLDQDGTVKLTDFGWSNYANLMEGDLRTSYGGTPEYLAPEMVKKSGHSVEVDIWALGVLMFELLVGKSAFPGRKEKDLFRNIQNIKIRWPEHGLDPLAKNLIERILKNNPKERPTLEEILNDPWFAKNPPLKPLLKPENITERQLIESFLICPKDEEGLELKINAILNDKGSCFKKILNKENFLSESYSTMQSYKSKEKEKNSIKRNIETENKSSTKAQNIQKGSNINHVNTSNINLNNSSSINSPTANQKTTSTAGKTETFEKVKKESSDKRKTEKNEESIERLRKENIDLKKKIDKYETELKKLRIEVQKLKEANTQSLEKAKNNPSSTITEDIEKELEKFKKLTTDQNNEIEKKSNEIVSLSQKLKECSTDLENQKAISADLAAKKKEKETQIDVLDSEIKKLNEEIIQITKNKEGLFNEYKKKIEMVRKVFYNEGESVENVNLSNQILSAMLNDSFGELKGIVEEKMNSLNKLFTINKEDFNTSENQIKDLLGSYESKIKEILSNKTSIVEEFKKISTNIITDEETKINERMEWQKKQITELMSFRFKLSELENKIEKLGKENEIKALEIQCLNEKLKINEKLLTESQLKLKKKVDYIRLVESRFADVNDYIIRNFKDHLEDFSKWIHFSNIKKEE